MSFLNHLSSDITSIFSRQYISRPFISAMRKLTRSFSTKTGVACRLLGHLISQFVISQVGCVRWRIVLMHSIFEREKSFPLLHQPGLAASHSSSNHNSVAFVPGGFLFDALLLVRRRYFRVFGPMKRARLPWPHGIKAPGAVRGWHSCQPNTAASIAIR